MERKGTTLETIYRDSDTSEHNIRSTILENPPKYNALQWDGNIQPLHYLGFKLEATWDEYSYHQTYIVDIWGEKLPVNKGDWIIWDKKFVVILSPEDLEETE